MSTRLVLLALTSTALLAGCDQRPDAKGPRRAVETETETVDIPQTVTAMAPGTTPMAQRVAVIGLLNKRNGLSRDLTMRPGQAMRVGDVTIRLRACEMTAPWEIQQLTGTFVQVDVRNPQNRVERIFSGWLYKETPSLNVVEHPVYDVWPKSCAMTHPSAGESTVREGSAPSRRSSAPNSAASGPAAAPPVLPAPVDNAADSNAI